MQIKTCECTPDCMGQEKIDKAALSVIRRLYEAGHTAYLVGGCVRDMLLGRVPKDFDVATTARPAQIRRLFSNSRLVGRRFRLAHVCCGKKIIEVATFRRNPDLKLSEYMCEDDFSGDDGIVLDNTFGSPKEDAWRRDFKINGLFFDFMSQEMLDFVGGLEDMNNRLVSTIGVPEKRFAEDPVRMLRAIKFCAKLGFAIEKRTWEAILKKHSLIKTSSLPRVQEELLRFLELGCSRRSFHMLLDSGLLADLVPGITKYLTGSRSGSGVRSRPGLLFDRLLDLSDQLKFEPAKERAYRFTALILPMFVSGCFKHGWEDDSWIDGLVSPMSECFGLCRHTQCEVVQYLMNLKHMLSSKLGPGAAKDLASQASFPYSLTLFNLLCQIGEADAQEYLHWRELCQKYRHSRIRKNSFCSECLEHLQDSLTCQDSWCSLVELRNDRGTSYGETKSDKGREYTDLGSDGLKDKEKHVGVYASSIKALRRRSSSVRRQA
ncbi:MAG: hypothetical protein ACI38Q_02955 [Candidatus Bruticola sp.]